jgi:aminocarboxymuconate-semialdehyde decarboxylase
MPVIDVHTHMLSESWVATLQAHGGPRYDVRTVIGGQRAVHLDGAPFMTLTPGMFDYGMRVAMMDEVGIDVSVVSLTCPSVYWGGREVSRDAARAINDDMAAAQRAHPARIRFFATLPWQHAGDAIEELRRACDQGAVGVMVLGNIAGMHLTDPSIASVWEEIDRRGLPVLLHPTVPPGYSDMALENYNLVASVGFMWDTTLAVSRMVYDGFFDRYRNLKLIASHAGATLPYLAGRLDRCHEMMPACRVKISDRPSDHLKRIWYDSIAYTPEALSLCVSFAGQDRVLFGSDYPHNIGNPQGLLAMLDALDPATRAAVRGDNALGIFAI